MDRQRFSAGLLRTYLFYRFFLALLLLGAFIAKIATDVIGSSAPDLYLSTAIIYVVVAVITLGFYQLQHHRLNQTQLFITLFADIAAQTVLMYCSGGLGSGIGYLMLVTVAAGSIFFTGQLAVLIPAIASICIILESLLSSLYFQRSTINVFPAGILGVLLFVTSLIFSQLSKALVIAQQVAESESEVSAGLQELNQLIIDRMHTGILVVDDCGVIQQINSAARELLGRGEGPQALRIGDSISPELHLQDHLRRWHATPGYQTDPFVSRFGNLELQANFASLEHGGSQRTIVFLEDLRAANQQAQQLKLAALGRLAGSIAHEIRNPLGAISHASELLSEVKGEDRTTTRLTEIIATHVKRVDHIVESVLQLSRKQDHQPQKIALTPWLKTFIGNFQEGNRGHPEIALETSLDPGDTVTFDPIHLQQVLTNLLDNAVRYSLERTGTPWAGIVIGSRGNNKVISLDVIDRGHGVPTEHLGKLFEPFFTTSPGGSGLGLFIARELCAINFATLKYQPPSGDSSGFFRIGFVHPEKHLNLSEDSHETQQGTDH